MKKVLSILMALFLLLSPVQTVFADTVEQVSIGGEIYAQLMPGYSAQLSADVVTDGEDKTVSWSVSGNTSYDTSVSQSGLVTIGLDETAEYVIVTATAMADPSVSNYVELRITYPAVIESITLSPLDAMDAGTSASLYAEVSGSGDYDRTVSWYVGGNTSAGTMVEDGVLYIGEDEMSGSVSVTAVANGDSRISSTMNVTVIPLPEPEPVVTGIAVSGSSRVRAGQSAQYTAKVRGENDYDPSVSWSILGAASSATSISAGGVLTVGLDETAEEIIVVATSNQDASVSKEMAVAIAVVKTKEVKEEETVEKENQKTEATQDFTNGKAETQGKENNTSGGSNSGSGSSSSGSSGSGNTSSSTQTKTEDNKKNETEKKVDEEIEKVIQNIVKDVEDFSKEQKNKEQTKETETKEETKNVSEDGKTVTYDAPVVQVAFLGFMLGLLGIITVSETRKKLAQNE